MEDDPRVVRKKSPEFSVFLERIAIGGKVFFAEKTNNFYLKNEKLRILNKLKFSQFL